MEVVTSHSMLTWVFAYPFSKGGDVQVKYQIWITVILVVAYTYYVIIRSCLCLLFSTSAIFGERIDYVIQSYNVTSHEIIDASKVNSLIVDTNLFLYRATNKPWASLWWRSQTDDLNVSGKMQKQMSSIRHCCFHIFL